MGEQNLNYETEVKKNISCSQILGPVGTNMTIKDLPSPNTKRWVMRRKAEVVTAVRGGLISLKDALLRYNLSLDEFRSWQRLFDNHGMRGLRTTKINLYRS